MNEPVSVVYVLGRGSTWGDCEICFSLRSIEKHLSNIKDVWIVGWLPPFLKDVKHIPMEDTSYLPDTNIMRKILRACDEPEISNTFLFFNDDHYLLGDFNAASFPFYYSTTLEKYVETRMHTVQIDPDLDRYTQANLNTIKLLKEQGHATKNFDIHYPMLYQKEEAKRIFNSLPPQELEAPWHGFILKSIYANAMGIEGVELQRDCKFTDAPPPHFKCLSTYPTVKGSMYRFLIEQFMSPSKYEIIGQSPLTKT